MDRDLQTPVQAGFARDRVNRQPLSFEIPDQKDPPHIWHPIIQSGLLCLLFGFCCGQALLRGHAPGAKLSAAQPGIFTLALLGNIHLALTGARHSRQRVVAPLGRGARVAEGPSRLDVSLHADLGVVDERRGGVLLKAGAAATEERCLRLARRLRRGDRGIHRASQRQGRPPVPVEPRPGGSRGVLKAGSPEAPGNRIK